MPRRFTRTYDRTRRARNLRANTSLTESRLWPRLMNARLGAPFRTQHPIGRWFADYCCVPLKLVIEIDGPLHSSADDAARDAGMRALGFDVMRFTARQMDEEFETIVEAIWSEVQLRLQRAGFDSELDDGGRG